MRAKVALFLFALLLLPCISRFACVSHHSWKSDGRGKICAAISAVNLSCSSRRTDVLVHVCTYRPESMEMGERLFYLYNLFHNFFHRIYLRTIYRHIECTYVCMSCGYLRSLSLTLRFHRRLLLTGPKKMSCAFLHE